jgi:AhpC/TSA family
MSEEGGRFERPDREDRFDDLTIGERLAERDRTHPEPVSPPEVPRPGNKYAWAVGIVALMGLAVLLFAQTIPNSGEGLRGPEPGTRLKAFAAPSARGPIEGDANVCQREPCPEQAGAKPACELVSEDVVNLCELRRKPLVLTFIFDRGADCYPQVDRTERLRAGLGDVQFATVFFSRKERDEIRRLVEARGWTQPVGVDEDGAVANLYGVGGCPTTIFARAGGRVVDTELGNITEDELRRRAERLRG